MKYINILILSLILSSCATSQQSAYPKIVNNTLSLEGYPGTWDEDAVHTFSIVEANKDGYRYWGYYALDHYEKDPHIRKGGLARSNDLMNWEKYEYNPIILKNCRWPTVAYQDGVFYMFYAEYNEANDSRIVMASSQNGIDFEDTQVVVPYVKGEQNQNPFIYIDPNDNNFYLFYYNGTERAEDSPKWNVHVKRSKTAHGLVNANSNEVLSADATLAAPSVAYYKGTYYMLVEEFDIPKDKWVTNAFYSNKVDRGYKRVTNNPILEDNDACAFQYVLDGQLHATYSHCLDLANSKWNLRIISMEK